MILDLRTIFVSGAMTCFVIGATLLLAFATGRFTRWPAWWGVSSLCIGTGLLCGALRGRIPDVLSIEFGNTINIAGAFLLLLGVRSFAGKAPRWGLFIVVLAATWLMLAALPGQAGFRDRVIVTAVLLGICDAAIAREGLLLARREGLRSGWILAGFFAPTVLLYAARAIAAVTEAGADTLFPPEAPVQSWIAAGGIGFVILRGNALLLLAAERSNDALALLARRDPLTGLLNRAGLEEAMTAVTRRAAPPAPQASLLLIDIDHFKTLNDTLGHAAGDEMLCLFADIARETLRATDIIARQGGDEFAVVLPAMRLRDATGVAERLREAFQAATGGRPDWPVRPTLSIGIAEAQPGEIQLAALLREADAALYRAKHLGRDRVQGQLSAAGA